MCECMYVFQQENIHSIRKHFLSSFIVHNLFSYIVLVLYSFIHSGFYSIQWFLFISFTFIRIFSTKNKIIGKQKKKLKTNKHHVFFLPTRCVTYQIPKNKKKFVTILIIIIIIIIDEHRQIANHASIVFPPCEISIVELFNLLFLFSFIFTIILFHLDQKYFSIPKFSNQQLPHQRFFFSM